MSTTISKLILDIKEELNKYIVDRQRLSQNKYDYFDGKADGVKQALEIIARIATNNIIDYRIMIAGGRDFSDYKLLKESLDKALQKRKINKTDYNIIVVSGKAKGADTLGEKYAKENNFTIEEYPAKWNDLEAIPCKIKINAYGNSYNCLAGMNRNKDMVEVSDLIVLFHDGVSKGTMDDLNLAKKYDKELEYIKY